MAEDGETEIYRQTATEFRATLSNLIKSHHELNQRAIDLARIDILAVSIFITTVTVVGIPEFYTIFAFGLLSMIVSLGYCIHVYRPRDMNLGPGPPEALDNIQDAVENDISEAEYYRKISIDLQASIQSTDKSYTKEVESFRNSLWSAIGGIMFLSTGLLQFGFSEFTTGCEYLLIFLISMAVLGGRGLYVDNKQ
ncbi:hypothetical protein PNP59_04665 [Halobacterium salinarum]|uniref:hypothetical protein n=1 Tax=Halobacterium salinarum TaxID=2242 RepID=UPI0025541CFD|nr:hypothetical protein [Halobacterium salinarum]MDL0130229.1 hypothetical protein [Halobacterium salinarum]MDL0133151.1 hypothetical protein [Halobacterium salinarum]